jgi:hypothetical protein
VNRKETKSQNPDSPLSTRKPSESTTHHDPSQQRRNQKKHRRRKGHTRKQRRMVLTKPKGVRQWCSHKRLRRWRLHLEYEVWIGNGRKMLAADLKFFLDNLKFVSH